MAEAELDALPSNTARAVQDLAEYQWRSPEAAEKYQQIKDLLRSELLDAQFAGMRNALQNADQQDMQRVREMMNALNDMLDADARGEHTPEQFAEFMQQYGDFFPDNPANLDELIDSLAQRAAAMQRLMNSLTPEQRAELDSLMEQAMADAGLAEQMARLQAGLRSARPNLPWGGRERMNGDEPMGFADATSALSELADLDRIAELASQNYPGASLGRHRRRADRARAGSAGGRRHRATAAHRARAATAGLPRARFGRAAAEPARDPAARRDRAATGVLAARVARPRRPRRPRRGRGR